MMTPEVDGLVSSLAAEIKTAEPRENGRTDAENHRPTDTKDIRFNEAFLDALADRLAMRIFDRAKEIDANAASAGNDQRAKVLARGNRNKEDGGRSPAWICSIESPSCQPQAWRSFKRASKPPFSWRNPRSRT
jgi:hypothetical protein